MLPNAGDVSKWPPPVLLDIAMVLQCQCSVADDRSTAGGVRASSGESIKQATTDSCIESSGALTFCLKKRKQQRESFRIEPY